MMKEKRHVSIIAIRRLFNFIRLFDYLQAKDPKIQETINEKLGSFIKDPESRNKENCANILDY